MTSVNDMPAKIPEDVSRAAVKAVIDSGLDVPRTNAVISLVARAILYERKRCLDIVAAEREWGDCHPDDIVSRIEAGKQARQIPGWNCPSEE